MLKNSKSDFSLMLDALVDKVNIYKTLFMGKQPKFMHEKKEEKAEKSAE